MRIFKVSMLLFGISSFLSAQEIITLYGTFDVTEPVLLELLETQAMQRLKKVHQSGIRYFVRDPYVFTRYEHSVGVCMLCRKFGASLQEQAAALLHDASHTAFSHVGDMVFDNAGSDAYQDAIHEWYIKQTDAYAVLEKYDMAYVISDNAKEQFAYLERDLPDVCADRLEYNLHVGLHEGLLTPEDIDYILKHLCHTDGTWYFTDLKAARTFAEVTELLTRYLWGNPDDACIYDRFAQALKRALTLGIVTSHELHFGADELLWNRVHAAHDAIMARYLSQTRDYKASYFICNADNYDYFYQPKCRAVDPLVKSGGQLLRLSELDAEYAQHYNELVTRCKTGYYLKFKNT